MSRIETVQAYFIEQFVTAIAKQVAVQEPALTQPTELFTAGVFNVTPDAAGFVRIPTLDTLASRGAAATNPSDRQDLETFAKIVTAAAGLLTFGTAPMTAAQLTVLAERFAPQVRQNEAVSFWPTDVATYLNFDDGTLQGCYYDPNGRTPLGGQLFQILFENPAIPAAGAFDSDPYTQRIPFVATVGVQPPATPYPTSPLNVGLLNLSAADARFYPGAAPPVLYAELKAIPAAVTINQAYQAAAATGRFAALRNNRLQQDPLLRAATDTTATSGPRQPLSVIAEPSDNFMIVYHAFYPVDDEARETHDMDATNREGHHLAAGILLPAGRAGHRVQPSYLLYCAGPDDVRVIPFEHPAVQRLDGTHVILYAGWATPLRLQLDKFFSSTLVTISGQEVSTADGIIGGLIIAAAIAAAAGGPVGWVVAVICIVIAVLLFLACLFFVSCGQPESSNPPPDQYQPKDPSTDPQYQNVGQYLAPEGTGIPGHAFNLQLIPHMIDRNLYGLIGGTAPTFQIDNVPQVQDMLGWVSFPGGIGYQVERQMPGKSERSGSQWRDYFTLFVSKLEELEKARALVTYFGP